MPIVYRIEVSDEEEQKGLDASLAGVITFDGKKAGKVIRHGLPTGAALD